jgi:small subunit ribosomal protein S19
MSNSRAQWKGPFIGEKLKSTLLKKEQLKDLTYERDAIIPNLLVGKTILVHNGKELKRVFINREKVGYKFGEFAYTRKFFDKRMKTKSKK